MAEVKKPMVETPATTTPAVEKEVSAEKERKEKWEKEEKERRESAGKEADETLDKVQQILHEYQGQEGNIPLGHEYWSLQAVYRAKAAAREGKK